jgi:hypothetical protein
VPLAGVKNPGPECEQMQLERKELTTVVYQRTSHNHYYNVQRKSLKKELEYDKESQLTLWGKVPRGLKHIYRAKIIVEKIYLERKPF